MSYRFLLEQSPTRIYQRIIESFRATLEQFGHTVLLIDPCQFQDYQDYLRYIQDQAVDYCLITNPKGFISTYLESLQAFLFEQVEIPIIFVHHDNFLSDLHDIERIHRKLAAWQRMQHRSIHFCLEYHNFLDLRSLGIERVYPIRHASEFTQSAQRPELIHEATFVGHVLPSLGDELAGLPVSHRLRADFWARLVNFETRLEPSAITFAQQACGRQSSDLDTLTAKYFYISLLHLHSQFFRGEVLRRIDSSPVTIIGGDPAYLHGVDRNQQIQKDNIRYQSATSDYADTRVIYARSKVNLNITSLQFDQAVINRVIDIGAAGGFVLTDWKADLSQITSVADAISYRSIEELNDKLEYYLHPDHESERRELAEVLHQDIQRQCTYEAVVEQILAKLHATSTADTAPVRIDLGCGPWKAPGFIGVDIAPAPGVDVVADLTQRFPFADSSVDWVRAHDVIEHLPDRIHTMNEIWRICKPNGMVDIRVPSTDGRGAFQDPTHVSFWNANSFRYYCQEFPNYLTLGHLYGFRGTFSLVHLSEEVSDDQVIHVRATLKAIKPEATPSEPLATQSSGESIAETLPLRRLNWLVCPDWQQPEEVLFPELAQLLQAVLTHPDRAEITLLIAVQDIAPDEADTAITAVLMHLMTEAGLEIGDDGPELSLLSQLDRQQWQALQPHLTARVALSSANAVSPVVLPVLPLAELPRQRLSSAAPV
ncbi:MAG: glycosyltransferase [Synechococcales cyanobacterium C42_A2020_086]|jgi:SAM-dependent methyltransferase|nr:glycosyltransferase [Synechococcales cyanobacterium C42_A2020_086]